MNRKRFLQLLTLAPIGVSAMKLNELYNATSYMPDTPLMPAIFFGHGSPMNAIELNKFTQSWRDIARNLPRPKGILCISAHWETRGTKLTASSAPKTIHDFGGFPQALFDVQYPALGSPELVSSAREALMPHIAEEDLMWGLDHGTWSVLAHLFPAADVPVVQLSLDIQKDEQFHFDLGKKLSALRRKGFLVIGSGNMVHNLGMLAWNKPDTGFDWAIEANEWFKNAITTENYNQLTNYRSVSKALQLSIPTPEHYRPLLYVLGMKQKDERVTFFNDFTTMGSISMTGVMLG
jgi:4,5-DOPA dioxygenase extradiol